MASKLGLHPERAAAHRLADSIWWGQRSEPLHIATLPRSRMSWLWLVLLIGAGYLLLVAS